MRTDNVPADNPSVIAEVASGEGITLSHAAKLVPPHESGRYRPSEWTYEGGG
jgi:hypothetical protein